MTIRGALAEYLQALARKLDAAREEEWTETYVRGVEDGKEVALAEAQAKDEWLRLCLAAEQNRARLNQQGAHTAGVMHLVAQHDCEIRAYGRALELLAAARERYRQGASDGATSAPR